MRSRLGIGFALGPIILALIGWVAFNNTADLADARGWVTHTYRVLEAANGVVAEVAGAEGGQRGYILTGDERYLAPYEAAKGVVDQRLKELSALTADNPQQQSRARELEALAKTRFDLMQETIALRRDQGFDAALAHVRSDRGLKIMEAIRSLMDTLIAEERRLLDEREVLANRTTRSTYIVIVAGAGFAFVLLAAVGWVLYRSISRPITQAVYALASSTAEILAGTSQQAAGMEEQAAAVAETVSTVDEITQTAEQANERVKAVADAARRASEIGSAGRRAVQDTVSAMSEVRQEVEATAQSIIRLAEQAQAIGEIIAVVSEIADQTNLLALNAAIEASRAGEHGRSFGVVAGEIKGLADQSKKATVQVRQILGDIQKATSAAVGTAERGSKSVTEGFRTVADADGTIAQLSGTIAEVAQAAAQITASAGQQAIGMAQIQQAMHGINAAATQNLQSTKQAELTAHDLNALGARLKVLLDGAAAA